MPSENKTPHYGLNQWQGNEYAKRQDFVDDNATIDVAIFNTGTHTATHARIGTVNNLDIPDGAKNLTFLATADLADGDTWTVNSQPVTAVLQNGEALPGELFKAGCWVTGVRLSDDGTQLFFRAGASTVPSIFGNGSDGDAVISGTVTLPVPVPHQSIVEKQYKSLTINAGAILKCAAHNAGLIIRVQGDCTIHGTIDQSGLAPKTNPQNTFPYPAQLVCGDGGAGGNGGRAGYGTGNTGGYGGAGMLKRSYGGGYGGGGGGGKGYDSSTYGIAANGGASTGSVITVDTIFVGGAGASKANLIAASSGMYGGGGGGGSNNSSGQGQFGGAGATGPGSTGGSGKTGNDGGGGGAGNYGGGVILLYVGGNLIIDGSIISNGARGGAGGDAGVYNGTMYVSSGGGGGGGGGGAIYICYKGTYTNTGLLQVNGASGGTPGAYGTQYGSSGAAGSAGGIGSITTIKYAS